MVQQTIHESFDNPTRTSYGECIHIGHSRTGLARRAVLAAMAGQRAGWLRWVVEK